MSATSPVRKRTDAPEFRMIQRRINFLLLSALGKEWLKDYLRHDLLHRNTRMRNLVARASRLGKNFAESLL